MKATTHEERKWQARVDARRVVDAKADMTTTDPAAHEQAVAAFKEAMATANESFVAYWINRPTRGVELR